MVSIPHFAPAVNPPAPYLTEVLGQTRTYQGGRTMLFFPSADGQTLGTVELLLCRTPGGKPSCSCYTVAEFAPSRDWNGRGFMFTKADRSETRAVFLSAAGPAFHTCDCEGTSYGSTFFADRRHGNRVSADPCKHVAAAVALVRNGWDAHPMARPEASEPMVNPSSADVPALAAA